MAFNSIEEMLKTAKENEQPLWEVIFEDDIMDSRMAPELSMEKMKQTYGVMKETYGMYDPDRISNSGLVGDDGERMAKDGRSQRLYETYCCSTYRRILRRAPGCFLYL